MIKCEEKINCKGWFEFLKGLMHWDEEREREKEMIVSTKPEAHLVHVSCHLSESPRPLKYNNRRQYLIAEQPCISRLNKAGIIHMLTRVMDVQYIFLIIFNKCQLQKYSWVTFKSTVKLM